MTYLESEFHSLPTSGSEIEQEDETINEAEIIAEVNSEIKSETKSGVEHAFYQTSQIATLIETVTSEIHANIYETQSVNKLDTEVLTAKIEPEKLPIETLSGRNESDTSSSDTSSSNSSSSGHELNETVVESEHTERVTETSQTVHAEKTWFDLKGKL